MKVVTGAQMRDLDRRAMDERGIPADSLMERAGEGVARTVMRLARLTGLDRPIVHAFAGRGNNGGDVFVAARLLQEDGMDVVVWVAGDSDGFRGTARKKLAEMKDAGIKPRWMPLVEDWDNAARHFSRFADLAVDGLLGTGISGPARGPVAAAIRYVNMVGRNSPVVSVDVPSGLNADSGKAEGDVVRADVTVTMGLPKSGLIAAQALEYVGGIEVVDIGLPSESIRDIASDIELVTASDLLGLIPRRPRASHKGSFGHVLLVGGAAGYQGAICMAACAAVRSGAGLVSALVPEGIVSAIAGTVPEVMMHPGNQTERKSLRADCLKAWGRPLDEFDAILIGPGLTACDDSRKIVEELLASRGCPAILDADAINVCGNRVDMLKESRREIIVTPHPGEMARLLGVSVDEVCGDRLGAARKAADDSGAVVVLKGAGTLVACPAGRAHVNMTGNPGMASGGTGDVLAGLMSGFVAQGCGLFDAARLAVFLHGKAGDNAAWRNTQSAMSATDLIMELPYVFREITCR